MKNKINLIMLLQQTAENIREHEDVDQIMNDTLKSIGDETEELRTYISEEDDEDEREETLEEISDLNEQRRYILGLNLNNYDGIVDFLDNVLEYSPEEMENTLMKYLHLAAVQNSMDVDNELGECKLKCVSRK